AGTTEAGVRSVLATLTAFAARRRLALFGILPRSRAAGPLAAIAAARVAHLVTWDPNDPGRALLLPIKSNLGPLPPGLAYRIAPTSVTQPGPDGTPLSVSAPHLLWEPNPLPVTAADLDRPLSAPVSGPFSFGTAQSPGQAAQAFLHQALAAGPLP